MNSPVSSFGGLIILKLGLFKHVDLVAVTPETIAFRMLFFDELIVGNVCGQEGVFIGSVGAFGDMTKTGSKLVLCVFAWNESTVSRDLCSWVG